MSAPPPGPHPPPDEGSSRDDTAPGCVLFDAAARELARQQPEEAAFRLLALSDDPEWVHLRAALERGFVLACRPGPGETAASAADTALRLRNGLATVRWGQHVGALAHLLLLTLLDAEGLGVDADPHLDGLRPDVLAERDGRRALIEARAVTGMGRRPWARRAAGHPAHDGTPDADTAAHLRRGLGDVVLDKAHSYRKVLAEFNRHRDPGDQIRHIDRKYLNNRIEGDHSALKKLLNPMRGFKILRSAKATLQGIEAIRTIKNNHIHQRKSGPLGEIEHLHKLFGLAA